MKRASNRVNCAVYDAMAMRLSYNRPGCVHSVQYENSRLLLFTGLSDRMDGMWRHRSIYLLVFDPFRDVHHVKRSSSRIGTLMM